MIADYYFVRKQQLHTADLYQHGGEYSFSKGINYKAVAALLLGIVPNIPGFLTTIKVIAVGVVPVWVASLYNYAWFVGFFVSGISYIIMTKRKTTEELRLKPVRLKSSAGV